MRHSLADVVEMFLFSLDSVPLHVLVLVDFLLIVSPVQCVLGNCNQVGHYV